MSHETRLPRLRAVTAAAVAVLLGAAVAWSQATTSSIRGVVRDASGPIPLADVVAVETASGFQYTAQAGEDGTFLLSGLRPGTYEIRVSSQAYEPRSRSVQLLLGQEVEAEFVLSPSEVFVEGVTVVGETTQIVLETRSSELTTNITPQQIENLPQNNRNFLSFAALAPGIGFTRDTDAAGQTFRSGGANPKQVNVFIDGTSYKNDIIQGGAFMQDSSRGNPFPQNAVQEYKVLTQNFKAEYEKAAAAVITAVTKSGGNRFTGDLFYFMQDDSLVTQDDFAKERGDEEPSYDRDQFGLSFGGPLLRDRLHFFLSAEQNQRDVAISIFPGPQWDTAPANVRDFLETYPTGADVIPLDSNLYFGKLSWQPGGAQNVDFTYHRRDEEEVRGFGNQRVREGAENFEVSTDALQLRHQAMWGSIFNEATLAWQQLGWKTGAENFAVPHQNYIGLLDVGGKDSIQDLEQDKIAFRDDLSYLIEWHGTHTLKAGVGIARFDYAMAKQQQGNPTFEFRSDEAWQFPFKATFGIGDPTLDFSNTQYGLYLQDDWSVLDNLTLNLGVRYDYESNMLNNDWRTPADVRAGLESACRDYATPIGGQTHWCIADLFDIGNYTTDGDRSSYSGMIQPRVGFSWDVNRDGETVVFGGWGQYYDRVTLNDIFDEQFRHVYKIYTFCFTDDGTQPGGCGVPAIPWDPSYLSAAGLANLIASGATPGPEVFLLANDTKPPRSNQWTLGVRKKLGNWLAGLSYANSEGNNGLTWGFGTLPPGTPFNDRWGSWIPIPGYGFILRSSDVRKTRYEGLFLTLDRPYTMDARWGFNLSYSYAEGEQQGSLDEGTAFALDYVSPEDFEFFPANQDERHRLVMSGTVGLPVGFQISSIISLGSGTPTSIPDASAGWDRFVFRFNEARPEKYDFILQDAWNYRSVDLRLEWTAPAINERFQISLIGEAFNVFDWDNNTYTDWVSFFRPPAPEVNASYGEPTGEFGTRRYQIGARLRF